MKEYHQFRLILVLIAGFSFLEFASSNCSTNSDCKHSGEICCAGLSCRSKQNCRSCIIDTHCPAGEQCVHSHCTLPTKADSKNKSGIKSCSSDKDCNNSTEKHLKCCQGTCTTDENSCTSIPLTPRPSTPSSCGSWKECSHGEQCERGSCKKPSNVMLTKAGFLSAAILTGSVFLLILCCCFVRESKYSRQRYAERQRRRSRSRSRHRRRSTHQRRRSSGAVELHSTTTAVENRAFRVDSTCEDGLFIPPPEYPGESVTTTTDGIHNSSEEPSSPPPYYTLSFDLPPSYEESLQTEENRGNSLTAVA